MKLLLRFNIFLNINRDTMFTKSHKWQCIFGITNNLCRQVTLFMQCFKYQSLYT